MSKKKTELDLLLQLEAYIKDVKKGRQLQKNGKRLKPNSIRNYLRLQKHLRDFCAEKNFKLRIQIVDNSVSQFHTEQKYWKDFYFRFTNYLYDDLGYHDNNVGRSIKLLRSLFNFLINEKGWNIGAFHKKFYIPNEEVDFLVLSQDRLKELIFNTEKEKQLTEDLIRVKDVFVFGCTVALRYSDLMKLYITSLEYIGNST